MTADQTPSGNRPSVLETVRKRLSDGLARRRIYAPQAISAAKRVATLIVSPIIVIGLLLYLLSFAETSDGLVTWIRRSGLVFQLGGLVLVVIGLRRALTFFGKPVPEAQFFQELVSIWRVVMPPKPRVHELKAEGLVAGVSVAGRARLKVSGGTLEQRLENLERDLDALWGLATTLEKSGAAAERKSRDDLSEERRERQQADQELEKKLQETAIGNTHIELAGVVLVFLGITLATIPEEIAFLFRVG